MPPTGRCPRSLRACIPPEIGHPQAPEILAPRATPAVSTGIRDFVPLE